GRERFWVEGQDHGGQSQRDAVAHHRAAKSRGDGRRGQACARRAGGQFGKSLSSRAEKPDVHNGTGVAYCGKQQSDGCQRGEIDRAVIARDGGGGPARGLPQSRKHVACAWHSAPEGNRDPPRAWRQPLADCAPASQRRFCVGVARRRGWTRSWIVVVGSADWLDAQVHAFPDCVVDRSEPRNFGRNVWILPARHTDVCVWAGLKDLTQRSDHRSEGTCRGRYYPTSLEIFTAQPARGCATRVLARPP